jgi:hypothetical protein
MAANRGGQSGLGNEGGGASIFLQNLQLLGKLSALGALNFATSLLFNFNNGGGPADFKFAVGLVTPGPNGAAPVGDLNNPFIVENSPIPENPPIKNSAVYTLGAPIVASASPVTILSHAYTPKAGPTTLLILGAAQIINPAAVASSVDVGLYINGIFYTSDRTYQTADTGSGTLYTYYGNSTGTAITISLRATNNLGAPTISIPKAYITVIEY